MTNFIDELSRAEFDILMEGALSKQYLFEMRLREASDAGDTVNADKAEQNLIVASSLVSKMLRFAAEADC